MAVASGKVYVGGKELGTIRDITWGDPPPTQAEIKAERMQQFRDALEYALENGILKEAEFSEFPVSGGYRYTFTFHVPDKMIDDSEREWSQVPEPEPDEPDEYVIEIEPLPPGSAYQQMQDQLDRESAIQWAQDNILPRVRTEKVYFPAEYFLEDSGPFPGSGCRCSSCRGLFGK